MDSRAHRERQGTIWRVYKRLQEYNWSSMGKCAICTGWIDRLWCGIFVLSDLTIIIVIIIHICHNKQLNCCIVFFIRPGHYNSSSTDSSITEVHYIYQEYQYMVEWSRALDVRLSEWCCSVSMVWVQIPSREEHKFDSSKI